MTRVDALIRKGVRIPVPAAVEIEDTIVIDRIAAPNVVIFPGSRLRGASTYIAAGVKIGSEGPASVQDCQIGPNVDLKGGHFADAVFLEGAKLGTGAHVRGGTIIEEQASTAHCVGLKQTILFPYVTLGSLINFCDCLMAGGTSRHNHSEVGSSFIHFNYTPNQDKATASLIGDVPQGVMLNQDPIFLGGQGGLVGPCRIAYGTVSAAGTIVRKDQLKPGHLVYGGAGKGGVIPWKPSGFGASQRILRNNLFYVGNLFALRAWYGQVRRQFVGRHFPEELLVGLITTVDAGLSERLKRLRIYIERLGRSEILKAWEIFEASSQSFERERGRNRWRDSFLKATEIGRGADRPYLKAIRAFDSDTAALATRWLASIVDEIMSDGKLLQTN